MSDVTVELQVAIAKAADDKKARDIMVLDISQLSPVADYFILCSGASSTQTKAIADHIMEQLQHRGIKVLHVEGYQEGRWILLDYSTCVVHVFHEQERVFYNLERLWADAKQSQYASGS